MLTPHLPSPEDYDDRLDALIRTRARQGRWRRWGLWLLGATAFVPAVLGWLTLVPSTPTLPPVRAGGEVHPVTAAVPPTQGAPAVAPPASGPARAPAAPRQAYVVGQDICADLGHSSLAPQMARQLAQRTTIMGEQLRRVALDQLRQRTPVVHLVDRIGGRTLNLDAYGDFEIALEQAFFIPEVIQAYWDEIHRQAPGNPALQEECFRHVFHVPGHLETREQWELMQEAAAQPGGLAACQRRLIRAMGDAY